MVFHIFDELTQLLPTPFLSMTIKSKEFLLSIVGILSMMPKCDIPSSQPSECVARLHAARNFIFIRSLLPRLW